jgi:N-acetylneuraminate synthase
MQDATRMDYWRRMEFSPDQWAKIKEHTEAAGLQFLCSPFSIKAFELLEKLSVQRYKIASGEVTNFLLLDKIAATGKPVLLSSGMSSYNEIEGAFRLLTSNNCDVSVFQCTTSYPTPAEQYGLNVLAELKARFNCPVGLSDHSGDIFAPIAAVALGASLVEVHTVFSKAIFGPDSKSSLEIKQLTELVRGIRLLDTALENPVNKVDNSKYRDLQKMFGKSLALKRDMKKGDILEDHCLETKKPGGFGIPPEFYKSVIGKKMKTNMEKGMFLNTKDFE